MIKSSANLHFFIAASLSARYLSLGCDNYFAVRIWIELMSGIRLEVCIEGFRQMVEVCCIFIT
ncbi:hypothetical protein [Pseudobutyrivibrio ruminis]|uniref:hypothetical protein n=1 Tax=Pseudobutyrivibrio ruminis TaxID=46206 RepID=UPI001179B1B7|nr:hypothetical protein [Pseudobutyrivibrio ruminis]